MKKSSYLIAMDSDGCALDAMEIKHRQCFTPAIIDTWQLQATADEVTEVALRINLYSSDRGINRFLALAKLFAQLNIVLPESKRGALPRTESLQHWIQQSAALSERTLEDSIQESGDHELAKVLQWTREVNRRVAHLPPPPAFRHVAEFLEKLNQHQIPAFVVSSATRGIIKKEWQSAGIAGTIKHFYGQEDGTKTYVLNQIARQQGDDRKIVMIGDAPGDSEAAHESGSVFFPIIPGQEEQSWQIAEQQLLTDIASNTLNTDLLNTRQTKFWQVLGAV